MIQFPIMEMFYSVQGEGFNSGMAAFFIRLAGCDVGCHWCDVKESWDAEKYSLQSMDDILIQTQNPSIHNIVITGGEPCMYDLTVLTKKLKEQNKYLMLETSGAYEIKGSFDWICVSPKKKMNPLDESLKLANELKVIIYNNNDFTWAEKNASQTSPMCKLFLQPEQSTFNMSVEKIIDYVKLNPQWRISLQTHKFMNIP